MKTLRAAAALLLALLGPLSAALPATAADTRAVLTLRVNTVPKLDATVVLRGDDVLVSRDDLEQAGLEHFNFHGAKPQDLVSLSSLQPDLKYTIDDKALALDITVSAVHLAVSTFNYHRQAALALSKPARSVFANYAAGFSTQAGSTFSTEIGTRIGAGLLQSSDTFAAHGQYGAHITQWVVDVPASNQRSTLGDVDITTGDLGASVALFGGEVERFFGLNPNTVANVLPGVRGSVGSPATADVYVNGTLVKQETLPPGQFDFQNLPVALGPNNTQIVVTDAFGRQQAYTNYFYGSDELLAPGVSDFAYGAGIPRAVFGISPASSAFSVAGRYSAGLKPDLTIGGRVEANSSLFSGGGKAIVRLREGVFGVDVGASHLSGATGEAAALNYQSMSRHLTVGASLLVQSPHYATLSQAAFADRPLLDASLAVSLPAKQSNLALIYTAMHDRDNGIQAQWQLTRSSALSPSAYLQTAASLVSGAAGKHLGLSATLNLIPRQNVSAFVTTSVQDGQSQTSASISKSTSSIRSLGYNAGFTATRGSSVSGYASGDYRGAYGNYFGTVNAGGSGPATVSLQAAGGLVVIGGKFFATQPLTDSYALVDTGLPGVRVTANGIDEGRTNRAGFAVITQLGSYFNNRVSLEPADVPMSYTIDRTSEQVVPEYRTGEVVHFEMKHVLPVTGDLSVLLGGRAVVPAYGLLRLSKGGVTSESDVGERGEFYFDSLAPGDYAALIQFKGGKCTFDMHVPTTQSTFLKLGTLVCKDGVPE